jgi:hypothetical protein
VYIAKSSPAYLPGAPTNLEVHIGLIDSPSQGIVAKVRNIAALNFVDRSDFVPLFPAGHSKIDQ